MNVRIFDCHEDGSETLRCECDLREAFPDDEDYHRASNEIQRSGRVWAGGGAQPLILVMGVRK